MDIEEKKEKTIYDLKLHESIEVNKTIIGGKMEITRVPGGFVYCFEYPGYRQSPIVFVPFVCMDKESQVLTKLTKKE